MTTTDATTQDAVKAPLAWSSLAIAVAGYLWALLYEKGLSGWGLLAFLLVTVVLVVGLRKPNVAVPIVTIAVAIAASVAVWVMV